MTGVIHQQPQLRVTVSESAAANAFPTQCYMRTILPYTQVPEHGGHSVVPHHIVKKNEWSWQASLTLASG